MVVFLNIGSNLGNRRLHLSRAVSALEKEFGYFELSHTVESKPQGYESSREFLNVGMMVNTNLTPDQLIDRVLEIEKSLSPVPHRDAAGEYIDREVDIDIIAIDDMIIDTPRLSVPHPRMQERRFVLEPMAELARFWVHPLLKKTPAELLRELDSAD